MDVSDYSKTSFGIKVESNTFKQFYQAIKINNIIGMKFSKLHHYGLATKSIDEGIKLFLLMGYSLTSEKIIDNIQKVEIVFFKKRR